MIPSLFFIPKESDLERSFNKLISDTFIKYKGCLIEKTKGEFKALGKYYTSEQEARRAIDESLSHFQNSIK